jgi:hypothetical protein
MSNVKLLRVVNKSRIEIFKMDATISHQISMRSTITDHPTEGGTTIAHNIRNEPIEITVTGYVSNYPIRIGLGVVPARDDSRRQTTMEALQQIRDNKELIEIQDELRVYQSMGMGSVDFPRDSQTFNGLRFTATFKEITVVGLEVVELEDDAQVKGVATPSTDLGKQTPTTSSDAATGQASTLWSIVN